MSIQSSEAAAPPRRRVPFALKVLLVSWAAAAALGALVGLVLAVTSLASGTPGTSPLARTGLGVFGGAFCGSLLALVLFGLYGVTWAVLALGRRVLMGSVRPKPAANAPAANGIVPGIVGAAVGLLVGIVGGGGLGFLAILVWIITDTKDPMMTAQAPFWGVVFGFLWGMPAGAVVGGLLGTPAGFVAGFRLRRRAVATAPAAVVAP